MAESKSTRNTDLDREKEEPHGVEIAFWTSSK